MALHSLAPASVAYRPHNCAYMHVCYLLPLFFFLLMLPTGCTLTINPSLNICSIFVSAYLILFSLLLLNFLKNFYASIWFHIYISRQPPLDDINSTTFYHSTILQELTFFSQQHILINASKCLSHLPLRRRHFHPLLRCSRDFMKSQLQLPT